MKRNEKAFITIALLDHIVIVCSKYEGLRQISLHQ